MEMGVTAFYICILMTLKILYQNLETCCLRGFREWFSKYAQKKVAVPHLYTSETSC